MSKRARTLTFNMQLLDADEPLPGSVADGRVLVHNHAPHAVDQPPGTRGFRAWTQLPGDLSVVPCRCGWSGLAHFRVPPRHRARTV